MDRKGRYQEAKRRLMDRYGGKCVACGVTELAVLTLDHVNNDGAEERRNGTRGFSWYGKLLKEGLRDDLQVLCANCQSRKRNYGGDFACWPLTPCDQCGTLK
jgi:hypothetical protein